MNVILLASISAMCTAQMLKVPFYYIKYGKWDVKLVFSTGSMPSSHTAFVTTLAISTGIVEGTQSSIYAVALVFALITIHDAVKVRGESGKQAKVLNSLLGDFTEVCGLLNVRNQKESEEKLKELIGHTGTEVLGGLFIGFCTAFIYFL